MKKIILISLTMLSILSKANGQSQADCNNLYLDTVTYYISPQQDTIVSGNLFYMDTTAAFYPALHLILADTSIITSPDILWLSFLDSGSVQPFGFRINFKTSIFQSNTIVNGFFHIYDSDSPGDSIVTCYFPITIILQNTTGISSINLNRNLVSVFPNPATNILNIQNNSTQQIQFTLYNSLGEKIIDKMLTDKTSVIDLSSYSADIYCYKLTSYNRIIKTGKIIKQ